MPITASYGFGSGAACTHCKSSNPAPAPATFSYLALLDLASSKNWEESKRFVRFRVSCKSAPPGYRTFHPYGLQFCGALARKNTGSEGAVSPFARSLGIKIAGLGRATPGLSLRASRHRSTRLTNNTGHRFGNVVARIHSYSPTSALGAHHLVLGRHYPLLGTLRRRRTQQ